ncbi:MAG: YcxB family protein [Clostridiales bacterium]|jgi:hypothetical protein|nr:YcxB family protein [Clostridiales bacterium]
MRVVFECDNLTEDYLKGSFKRALRISVFFTAFFWVLSAFMLGIDFFMASTMFIMGIVMFPLFLWASRSAAKKQIKTNKTYFGGKLTAVFLDDNFTIAQKNEISSSSSESLYDGIYKVEEYADVLFLYVSNMSVFTLNKKNIVEGTIEEFRQILKAKIGQKYKNLTMSKKR